MKKIASLLIISLVFILSACHYHNINGDLDGHWHMISYEQEDGTIVKPDAVYLGIAMHTFNLRAPGTPRAPGNMFYDAKAKTLALEFPYQHKLAFAGFPDSPCTVNFHILHLSKQKLIMKLDSNNAIYTFTKF